MQPYISVLTNSRGGCSTARTRASPRHSVLSALPQPLSIEGRPRASKKSPICPRRIEAISKSPTSERANPRASHRATPRSQLPSPDFHVFHVAHPSSSIFISSPTQHVAIPGAAGTPLQVSPLHQPCDPLRDATASQAPAPDHLPPPLLHRPSSASLPSIDCHPYITDATNPYPSPFVCRFPRPTSLPAGFHNLSTARVAQKICAAIDVATYD